MTTATDDQLTIRSHKAMGIASSIIGVTCIAVLILALMAIRPEQMDELRIFIGTGTFLGSILGAVLGLFGASDRSSKKLYPVIGLCLNIGLFALFIGTAIAGLLMAR
jgi:hypothetical protein